MFIMYSLREKKEEKIQWNQRNSIWWNYNNNSSAESYGPVWFYIYKIQIGKHLQTHYEQELRERLNIKCFTLFFIHEFLSDLLCVIWLACNWTPNSLSRKQYLSVSLNAQDDHIDIYCVSKKKKCTVLPATLAPSPERIENTNLYENCVFVVITFSYLKETFFFRNSHVIKILRSTISFPYNNSQCARKKFFFLYHCNCFFFLLLL